MPHVPTDNNHQLKAFVTKKMMLDRERVKISRPRRSRLTKLMSDRASDRIKAGKRPKLPVQKL